MKQLPCLPFPFDSKNRKLEATQNYIDVQWMHLERCVSTHSSRAGKTQTIIDLERADGRTKDHASFSPGNAASSMTNANLSPALWSSASVAIKTTQEQVVKARRTYTDGEKKPNRRIMSWFPGEMLHHQGQSKSASCFDEHCASRNSSKAIRSFSGPRVLLMRLWIADV